MKNEVVDTGLEIKVKVGVTMNQVMNIEIEVGVKKENLVMIHMLKAMFYLTKVKVGAEVEKGIIQVHMVTMNQVMNIEIEVGVEVEKRMMQRNS